MTPIKAVVRNGRIETEEPIELPEGTRVEISVPQSAIEEDDWDNSPEAIVAWLAWADSLEPLIFTDDERAAWEVSQKARKDWEKGHFDQYFANLRQVWE